MLSFWTLALLAGPTDAEILIDTASKEYSRIHSYQIVYNRTSLNLVAKTKSNRPPIMLGGPNMTAKAKDEIRKAISESGSRIANDPNALLAEDDPKALISKGLVRMTRDGASFLHSEDRSEYGRFGNPYSYLLIFAFDKGIATEYRSKAITSNDQPQASPIHSSFAFLTEASNMEAKSQLELAPDRLMQLLDNRLLAEKVFINNRKIIDAHKTEPWTLKHEIEPDAEAGTIAVRTSLDDKRLPTLRSYRRLVFDKSRGPMPIRIEIHSNAARQAWLVRWHSFADSDGKSIWFPSEIRKETSLNLKDKESKPYQVDTVSLDVAKSRINEPVEKDLLTFELPAGTIVSDKRTGEQYVKEPNKKNLDVSKRIMEENDPGRIEPPPPEKSGRRDNLIILCVASAVLAIIAGILMVRKRRGIGNSPDEPKQR